MTTEKRDQHYVPKFFLRRFSYKGNRSQIGLYNIKNDFFFPTAKLKSQAQKAYYYGKDGKIEDRLSVMENNYSHVLNKIDLDQSIPSKTSQDYKTLLNFFACTDTRNPASVALTVKKFDMANEFYQRKSGIVDLITIPTDEQQLIEINLRFIETFVEGVMDMDMVILLNKTTSPFIISDNPLVKYNSFMQSKKKGSSQTGYASLGLQLLIPIDPRKALLLYDPKIYKLGNRKQKKIDIDSLLEIESMNLLQLYNCTDHIYFNHEFSKRLMDDIWTRYDPITYSNLPKSTVEYKEIGDGVSDSATEVISIRFEQAEIKYVLSFITLTKFAKKWAGNPREINVRKGTDKIKEKFLKSLL